MERLTAFEFIAAGDGPQIVRIKKGDVVLEQFCFIAWVAHAFNDPWLFERRDDLVIEGTGIGRPYWNDEAASWFAFNPTTEAERLQMIRAAARREANRASLSLQ